MKHHRKDTSNSGTLGSRGIQKELELENGLREPDQCCLDMDNSD